MKYGGDEKNARTFYGISERFLDSRGCIKIFNTFIQFANEGIAKGLFCSRAMIKKWFVKRGKRSFNTSVSLAKEKI